MPDYGKAELILKTANGQGHLRLGIDLTLWQTDEVYRVQQLMKLNKTFTNLVDVAPAHAEYADRLAKPCECTCQHVNSLTAGHKRSCPFYEENAYGV